MYAHGYRASIPIGGNRVFSFWRFFCAALLLWFGSALSSVAAIEIENNNPSATDLLLISRPLSVLLVNGISGKFYFSCSGKSANRTFVAGVRESIIFSDRYVGAGSWEGLSSSSGPIDVEVEPTPLDVYFGSSFPPITGNSQLKMPDDLEFKVNFNSPVGGYVHYELEALELDIDPNTGEVYDDVNFHINNTTDTDQEIDLGAGPVVVPPGVSDVPYYGPVDSNGLPTGVQPDFQGTLAGGGSVNASNSPGEIYAEIGYHSSGEGTEWNSGTDPGTWDDGGTGDTGGGTGDTGGGTGDTGGGTGDTGGGTGDTGGGTGDTGGGTGDTGDGTGNVTNNYNTTNNTTNNNTTNNYTNEIDTGGPEVGDPDSPTTPPSSVTDAFELPGGALDIPSDLSGLSDTMRNKLDGFNPFADMDTTGHDFEYFDVDLPSLPPVRVNLPLDSPAIPLFRLCCLFAMLWRYALSVMKILKI